MLLKKLKEQDSWDLFHFVNNDIAVIAIFFLFLMHTERKWDLTLESEEALKPYATHPAHVAVADTYVRPYTVSRTCIDYEI